MNPSIFTELRFATPAIEEFANTLRQWFMAAVIGGLIYGPSRAGKSYAIEYVTQKRREIFGYDIPIVCVDWKLMAIREKDFHERFLQACGHSVPSDRSTNSLIESRLVDYLACAAVRSGASSLVMFIDEGQDMRLSDLAYLANIYNRLKRPHKIQMFTYLVGERKLTALRSRALDAGYERYVGRFMCADFEYPLLRSARDLAFVLQQYDTCAYPEGSGASIIQSKLPKAWRAGWRFADQANVMWNGFRGANRAVGKKTSGMTMQSCTILVAQLLGYLTQRDASTLSVTAEDIASALTLVRHLHNA